jgi:hypothetical protein
LLPPDKVALSLSRSPTEPEVSLGVVTIDGEAVICTDSSPQPLLAGLLLLSPEKSAVQFQVPASSAVTVEFVVG